MSTQEDYEMHLFKCNNPKCEFEIITTYSDPYLPDSDCPRCKWHDSVIDRGRANYSSFPL